MNQFATHEKVFIYIPFQLLYNVSAFKITRLNEKVKFTLGKSYFNSNNIKRYKLNK